MAFARGICVIIPRTGEIFYNKDQNMEFTMLWNDPNTFGSALICGTWAPASCSPDILFSSTQCSPHKYSFPFSCLPCIFGPPMSMEQETSSRILHMALSWCQWGRQHHHWQSGGSWERGCSGRVWRWKHGPWSRGHHPQDPWARCKTRTPVHRIWQQERQWSWSQTIDIMIFFHQP